MATPSYWRQQARQVIAEVLARPELVNAHPRLRRKALSEAYPFGPREHHPYRIWLDEVKRALFGGGVKVAQQTGEPGLFDGEAT